MGRKNKFESENISSMDTNIARARISRLEIQNAKLKERIRFLTYDPAIGPLHSLLEEKKAELAHLQEIISERDVAHAALQRELYEREVSYASLQGTLDGQVASYAELQVKLSEHEDSYADLQRELSEHEAANAVLLGKLSEHEVWCAALQDKLSEREVEYAALQDKLSEREVEYAALQSKLSEREASYDALQSELYERDAAYAALQGKLFELDGTTAEFASIVKNLEDRGTALDTALAEKEHLLSELRVEYEKSMAETDRYYQKATALEDQLRKVLDSLTWRGARYILNSLETVPRAFNLVSGCFRFFLTRGNRPISVECCQQGGDLDSGGSTCVVSGPLVRGVHDSRRTVVISSHDASRTGAPLIILNIARRLVADYGWKCLTILVRGGELIPDFEELGAVCVLDEWRQHPAHAGVSVDDLVGCMIAGHNPQFGILNSSESHPLYVGMRKAGVRFIGLVHEFADPYPRHVFQKLFDHSEEVIFPSQIVYDSAVRKLGKTPDNISICPQGLFDASFPQGDRDAARKAILKELDLDDNAYLVLGCGYVDLRKGCDIFAMTARQIKAARPDANVVFVWLGKKDTGININGADFIYWLGKDNETSRADKYVNFVGARTDVAPWFLAADCLYMSSRQDPFPCVVLEAMAARLPVVCFKDATGAVDAIGAEAGFAVPYLDIEEAAKKILYLHDNPKEAEKMGEAGRRRALDVFDYDKYVAALVDKIRSHAPGFFGDGKAVDAKACRKVFVPCQDWGLSGVNTLLEVFGGALREKGWDFRILFTAPEQDVIKSGKGQMPKNVEYEFLHVRSDANQKEKWARLIAFFESQAPCIMLTGYDYLSNSIAPALSNSVGVIGWNHADDMEYYEQAHRLGRYWNKMICVSKRIAEEIVSMNPSFVDAIEVIPNGAVRLDEIVKKKRPAGKTIKMVYAGRLVQYQKRVRDFAELVTELDALKMDYELTLVGEDHDGSGEYLKEKLAKHIQDGRVRMLGRLNRKGVMKVFEDSDLFLLISDFEGMPVSLVEAMAKGCVPVVADMKSGINEIVEDGINGIVIPGRKYENWAARIKDLIVSERGNGMSQLAVETIQNGYVVEGSVDKMDKIFIAVANDLCGGDYSRPVTFKWKSMTGDVLPPQNYSGLDHDR